MGRKAAELGHAEAQFFLASCYRLGSGVERDEEQVFTWVSRSAAQGFDEAQFGLGMCYHLGEGVQKDDAKAVHWFRKAAEQGHAGAREALAHANVSV